MPSANMREYMRKYRLRETNAQHERRLLRERQRYLDSLHRLGLELIGPGHRRDWNF